MYQKQSKSNINGKLDYKYIISSIDFKFVNRRNNDTEILHFVSYSFIYYKIILDISGRFKYDMK